jgi:diguanylate cyclase (GGDEF)-like protein
MQHAPLPLDESSRLAALKGLHILDTPAEERFDRITRLARRLFETKIVAISLVDSTRVWFKSSIGLDMPQLSRNVAFASHAIHDPDVHVVDDLREDSRFSDNPLVVAEPWLRFYAGCPLLAVDGSAIGVLELLDERPRSLAPGQKESLRDLARIAERELSMVSLSPAQEEIMAADAGGGASRVDPLTRLWTRAAIVDILQRELAHARREGSTVGLLLTDVDQLRNLNNTHGHEAGDAALRELTRRLRASLRPYDAVGRFGGEEFLCVLPGTDMDGCILAAERIRRSVASEPILPSGNAMLAVSIGAGTSDAASIDSGTLIRGVEQAVFKAKELGGNRVWRVTSSG